MIRHVCLQLDLTPPKILFGFYGLSMVAISSYGWDPPSLQAQFEKDCTERGVLERQTEMFNFQNVYSIRYHKLYLTVSQICTFKISFFFEAHVLKCAVFDIVCLIFGKRTVCAKCATRCVELPKNQNLSQTLRWNLFDVCCIEKSRGGVEGFPQTFAVNCCNCVCHLCQNWRLLMTESKAFSSGELGKFDITHWNGRERRRCFRFGWGPAGSVLDTSCQVVRALCDAGVGLAC